MNIKLIAMRKIIAVPCFAAGILALVACQKEISENLASGNVPMVTRSMTVEGDEWTAEGTKSVYEPGTGIYLTGDESMDVYYGSLAVSTKMSRVTDVVSAGGGKYTITHPEITDATSYDYNVITPKLHTTGTNSAGTSITFRFSPVQTPGQNTFDPNFDLLYGQGVRSADAMLDEIGITGFKRITAPFKVEISDGAGVFEGEKIRSVTTSFSKTAVSPDNDNPGCALVGLFYLNFGIDDYASCKLNSVKPAGNAVTAVYADGLEKTGDNYPVWYMVNPASLDSGELTVTVTTDTRTITRTVSLAGTLNIEKGKFNILRFDITGSGYTVAESVYTDFTSLSAGSLPSSVALIASNGVSYSWGFEKCSIETQSPLPNSLSPKNKDNGGKIILPQVPGKDITRIRLYANPDNAKNSNVITLNDDAGTAVNFNSYTEADDALVCSGGVLEIAVPESMRGTTLYLTSTGATKLNGIALVLEDNGDDVPEIDENDYYALFEAGHSIEINGEVYNIATHTAYDKLDVADLTLDNIKAAGIHFIDNTGQTEVKTITGTNMGNETVLIGRYKDSQPHIRFLKDGGADGQMSIRNTVTFKNMHISSGHTTSMFASTGANESQNSILVLEDCTLSCIDKGKTIISDNHLTKSFISVTLNNCLVEFVNDGSCVITYPAADKGKTDFSGKGLTVNNCVIYSKDLVTGSIISIGTSSNQTGTEDIDIVVTDNTVYNISAPNVLVRAYTANSLTVKNNVAYYATGEYKSYLSAIYNGDFPAANAEITGNYLYTQYLKEDNFWSLVHTGSFKNPVPSGNYLHSEADGCISSFDTENGYFPINTSVVTNGAGADYDTKYWIAH